MRMVGEDELKDDPPCIENSQRVGVDLHSFHACSCAGRSEVSSADHLDDTHTAGSRMVVHAGTFKVDVAEGRDFDTAGLCGIEDCSPLLD